MTNAQLTTLIRTISSKRLKDLDDEARHAVKMGDKYIYADPVAVTIVCWQARTAADLLRRLVRAADEGTESPHDLAEEARRFLEPKE